MNWALSDIHTFSNLKGSKSAVTQSGKGMMRKRVNNIKNIKMQRSIPPGSQKLTKNLRQFNMLMGKRESLPQVKRKKNIHELLRIKKGKPTIRNKSSTVKSKSSMGMNSDLKINRSLMNISKHKAGVKPVKKKNPNFSYNNAYGVLDEVSGAEFSSIN